MAGKNTAAKSAALSLYLKQVLASQVLNAPWCGCPMEVYKRRKLYTRYRCCSIHYKNRQTCRCKINVLNVPDKVLNTVSTVISGKTSFKHMSYPKYLMLINKGLLPKT